jgi:hypothetical protein
LKNILPEKPNEINVIFNTYDNKLKNILPSTIYTFGILKNKTILSLNLVFQLCAEKTEFLSIIPSLNTCINNFVQLLYLDTKIIKHACKLEINKEKFDK